MIYASSAATYGNLPSPQTVGQENPENLYGYSKYIMDQIAVTYSRENPDLTIVGLRFFNVYGPREFYKGITASSFVETTFQEVASGSDLQIKDLVVDVNNVLEGMSFFEKQDMAPCFKRNLGQNS